MVSVPFEVYMATKLLKSIGLILVTVVALVIGLQICIAMWLILSGLFLVSRFSKRVWFFTEWTWLQFLVTVVIALGVPCLVLLLSFEF
jgi:hypothetical protein